MCHIYGYTGADADVSVCCWRRTPPLTVYNAFFFMTVSFFFLAWGWNLSLLYKPLLECEESSMLEYALDWHGRLASCTAGWACGVGMALQFMGGLGGG